MRIILFAEIQRFPFSLRKSLQFLPYHNGITSTHSFITKEYENVRVLKAVDFRGSCKYCDESTHHERKCFQRKYDEHRNAEHYEDQNMSNSRAFADTII